MWLSQWRPGSLLIESLERPVDRMWKAARILRKVRPNFSPRCCGRAQVVEKPGPYPLTKAVEIRFEAPSCCVGKALVSLWRKCDSRSLGLVHCCGRPRRKRRGLQRGADSLGPKLASLSASMTPAKGP